MQLAATFQNFKKNKLNFFSGLGTPLLIMAALGMVILPMPSFLLDILFSFNIALSLVVLLITVYTLKPLEFGAFPAVLLIATILRLALNVASTRVVLLEGHEGPDAAGKVIEAFGSVVIGGCKFMKITNVHEISMFFMYFPHPFYISVGFVNIYLFFVLFHIFSWIF